MIRTADTFEPMGPFKVAMAKDIGIEVDGVEKSVQEAFDGLDFENLGKEEIEKVNELPDWEDADENKLYVVKSNNEPVSYTKLVSYSDFDNETKTDTLHIYASNNPNDVYTPSSSMPFIVLSQDSTEKDLPPVLASNIIYYIIPKNSDYYYLPKDLLLANNDLESLEQQYSAEVVGDYLRIPISHSFGFEFIKLDHLPTLEEYNEASNQHDSDNFWRILYIATESQPNNTGKLQIYLKDTSKTDCWFMIKVDNDALPVMNIIDENDNITSVPVDKVYFKPISIDDIWEE